MNLRTAIFNSKQVTLGWIGKPPLFCHSREKRSRLCSRCNPGDYFECLRCKRLMPFCRGSADIFEDWCDTCVGDYQRKEGFPERLFNPTHTF